MVDLKFPNLKKEISTVFIDADFNKTIYLSLSGLLIAFLCALFFQRFGRFLFVFLPFVLSFCHSSKV